VQAVGAVVGQGEQVGGGLGRRVGGTRVKRVLLGGRPRLDGAVDLVGGDVHEGRQAVPQGGVQQDLGADHIGEDEVGGGEDRAVDVRLGGEVHHLVRLAHELVDQLGVTDVALDELQARVIELQVVEGA